MKNQKSINKIICNKKFSNDIFYSVTYFFRQAVLALKSQEELNKSTKKDETCDTNKKSTDEVNKPCD